MSLRTLLSIRFVSSKPGGVYEVNLAAFEFKSPDMHFGVLKCSESAAEATFR